MCRGAEKRGRPGGGNVISFEWAGLVVNYDVNNLFRFVKVAYDALVACY